MPTYEYYCEACEAIFEELHLSREDRDRYSKGYPCKSCGRQAVRVPSASNFTFKGVSEGDPTRRGNSGVHDLDYPSLDKAVGRSANRKWKEYRARKAANDSVRREAGATALSVGPDGKVVPTDAGTLEAREKGLRLFKRARTKAEEPGS